MKLSVNLMTMIIFVLKKKNNNIRINNEFLVKK